ncbi:MAG: alpha/beta hydrolase [Rhodospirillaceae bacterium]|nr:alpha/beta hydrolase [Rhodospirillaceae bacterium]|tara:strand:- start:14941 stop:15819 length:879 start_codon:yes stop_codon:yes gene_type:complete
MKLRFPLSILISVFAIVLSGCASPPGDSGTITVNDGRDALAAPMTVYYYRPDTFKPDGPVLIALHGLSRNAYGYRNYFAKSAHKYGVLVLAPEFTRKNFRGSRRFNLGNLKDKSGATQPKSLWAFPVIDRVFEKSRAMLGFERQKYALFGHSAGSQFVHRMILFSPSEKMSAAVAANAGWYTVPDKRIAFPYGLKGTDSATKKLRDAFGQKLTILLGTDDNDESHKTLRKTEGALQQGSHRLARGRNFYQRSMEIAAQKKLSFRWQIREVPGVAHSGRGMAEPAANILFGTP